MLKIPKTGTRSRSKSTESINPYHATILIFYHSVNISSWKHSCLRKFLINSEHIMHVHAQTYCYVPFVFRGSRDIAFKKCTKLPKRTKEQECKRFGKLINKQIKNKTLPGLPYQPNTGEKLFSKENGTHPEWGYSTSALLTGQQDSRTVAHPSVQKMAALLPSYPTNLAVSYNIQNLVDLAGGTKWI